MCGAGVLPGAQGNCLPIKPAVSLRPSHPLGRFKTRTYHNGDANHAVIMLGDVARRSLATTSQITLTP